MYIYIYKLAIVQVCLYTCILDTYSQTYYLENSNGKEPTSRSQATMFPSKKGSRPVSWSSGPISKSSRGFAWQVHKARKATSHPIQRRIIRIGNENNTYNILQHIMKIIAVPLMTMHFFVTRFLKPPRLSLLDFSLHSFAEVAVCYAACDQLINSWNQKLLAASLDQTLAKRVEQNWNLPLRSLAANYLRIAVHNPVPTNFWVSCAQTNFMLRFSVRLVHKRFCKQSLCPNPQGQQTCLWSHGVWMPQRTLRWVWPRGARLHRTWLASKNENESFRSSTHKAAVRKELKVCNRMQ